MKNFFSTLLVVMGCAASQSTVGVVGTAPDATTPASLDASVGSAIVDAAEEPKPDVVADSPDAASAMTVDTDAGCSVRDIGQSTGGPLAQCQADADCAITLATCCSPCNETPLSMLRAASKASLKNGNPFCKGQVGCPRCMSMMPANIDVGCTKGACVLRKRACMVRMPNGAVCEQDHAPAIMPQTIAPLGSCKTSDECVVQPRACCPCGMLTAQQAVAVSRASLQKLREHCESHCPDCASLSNASLVGVCLGGMCHVSDLGVEPNCPALRKP